MIEERGALPAGEAVDYVLAVCEALTEAHAQRIVRRDIKPANIFLTRRPDGSPLVKVLDFGISKAPMPHGGSLTRSLVSIGTPAYMSPEQMRSARDVGPAADVWALGIVLYECLSGRRPFDADSLSGLALRIVMDPTPRLHAGLPGDLARVIYRCLEKEPSARFTSMADLAAALAPHATDRRAAATIVERTRMMHDGVMAGPLVPADDTPPQGFARGRRLAIRGAMISLPVVIATIWLIAHPGVGHDRSAAAVVPSLPKPSPALAPAPAGSAPSADSARTSAVPALTSAPEPASVSAPNASASVVRARTPRPTPVPPKSSADISTQRPASPRPVSPQSDPPQPVSPQPVSPQPVHRNRFHRNRSHRNRSHRNRSHRNRLHLLPCRRLLPRPTNERARTRRRLARAASRRRPMTSRCKMSRTLIAAVIIGIFSTVAAAQPHEKPASSAAACAGAERQRAQADQFAAEGVFDKAIETYQAAFEACSTAKFRAAMVFNIR